MKSPRSPRFLLPWLLILAACDGGDDSGLGAAGPRPLRECPELDFSRCDTREAACQERLLAIAQCVVGSEQTPTVPVQVVTEKELREQLEAEAVPPSAEELATNAILEQLLIDLDLAAKGDFTLQASIDNLLESFDGLYRDAERGITLIDRGQPQDSVEANALLVHELVHAVQDAQYDLTTLREQAGPETDSTLALKALVEGEATYYQYRVVAAMLGYDTADVDFPGIFAELRSDLIEELKADESGYVATFGTFPYAFGPDLMYDAWLTGRQGFEAELFANPPRTSAEIIRRSLGLAGDPVEPRTFTEPTASEGFTLLDEDTLGSFVLELCFYKKGLSAVTWLGDRVWVYTDADGADAWLWQLEVDGAAADLAPALELTLPSYVSVEGEGQRLFAVAHPERAPFLLEAGRAFLVE